MESVWKGGREVPVYYAYFWSFPTVDVWLSSSGHCGRCTPSGHSTSPLHRPVIKHRLSRTSKREDTEIFHICTVLSCIIKKWQGICRRLGSQPENMANKFSIFIVELKGVTKNYLILWMLCNVDIEINSRINKYSRKCVRVCTIWLKHWAQWMTIAGWRPCFSPALRVFKPCWTIIRSLAEVPGLQKRMGDKNTRWHKTLQHYVVILEMFNTFQPLEKQSGTQDLHCETWII